jgi:hypothetical protein
VGFEASVKAPHGFAVPIATTLASAVSLLGGAVVKVSPFELWKLAYSLALLASSLGVGLVCYFSLVQLHGVAARCSKISAELSVLS